MTIKPSGVQDIVERLRALHVWPQSTADTYPDTLGPRRTKALYEVGNVAHEAADEIERLCRTIEQHEAFRQEVSDAAQEYEEAGYCMGWEGFERFIILKPDPLVKVLNEISHEGGFDNFNHYAHRLRAALKARGLEIREKNDG